MTPDLFGIALSAKLQSRNPAVQGHLRGSNHPLPRQANRHQVSPQKRLKMLISTFTNAEQILEIQIPTRIPEKVVVALFSGILVISGIVVVVPKAFGSEK